VAIFILGSLTLHVDNKRHQLVVFWAPFLLLHLGGLDTITAFSMEDTELWKRHMLNLVSQVGMAIYVTGKQWQHQDRHLHAPMVLMFISRTIKYAERTWALYRVGSWTGSVSSVASAASNLTCGLYGSLSYYGRLGFAFSKKREESFSTLLQSGTTGFGDVLDILMDVSPANSVGTHVVSEIHDAQRHLQSSEDPVYIAYKLVDINLSFFLTKPRQRAGSSRIALRKRENGPVNKGNRTRKPYMHG
jgi:hypothetical protein